MDATGGPGGKAELERVGLDLGPAGRWLRIAAGLTGLAWTLSHIWGSS